MISLFRKIYENRVVQGQLASYIGYALNEILLVTKSTPPPVRDETWVERTNVPQTNRAVRYGMWVNEIGNHVAYLTARCYRFSHLFQPICSPYGTALNFNQPTLPLAPKEEFQRTSLTIKQMMEKDPLDKTNEILNAILCGAIPLGARECAGSKVRL